jgi:hypothetical protein
MPDDMAELLHRSPQEKAPDRAIDQALGMRTHTTAVLARRADLPCHSCELSEHERHHNVGKCFSIDRVFRKEEMDRTHLCEVQGGDPWPQSARRPDVLQGPGGGGTSRRGRWRPP